MTDRFSIREERRHQNRIAALQAATNHHRTASGRTRSGAKLVIKDVLSTAETFFKWLEETNG